MAGIEEWEIKPSVIIYCSWSRVNDTITNKQMVIDNA